MQTCSFWLIRCYVFLLIIFSPCILYFEIRTAPELSANMFLMEVISGFFFLEVILEVKIGLGHPLAWRTGSAQSTTSTWAEFSSDFSQASRANLVTVKPFHVLLFTWFILLVSYPYFSLNLSKKREACGLVQLDLVNCHPCVLNVAQCLLLSSVFWMFWFLLTYHLLALRIKD